MIEVDFMTCKNIMTSVKSNIKIVIQCAIVPASTSDLNVKMRRYNTIPFSNSLDIQTVSFNDKC